MALESLFHRSEFATGSTAEVNYRRRQQDDKVMSDNGLTDANSTEYDWGLVGDSYKTTWHRGAGLRRVSV